MKTFGHLIQIICFLVSTILIHALAAAQQPDELPDLNLEDLMRLDVTVTSASKREELMFDTAAATFVITEEDIRRSGATSIPEVLRTAPGVQVARTSAHEWAVTLRGLNGAFARYVLVLIDGRSLYKPLFSGVSWDERDVLLEDVQRIEIVRGPGGSLWGANAVNGIINIVTKNASQTRDNILTVSAGNLEKTTVFRHGGQTDSGLNYRVHGKLSQYQGFEGQILDKEDNNGYMARFGFRSDWEPDVQQEFMLQGDVYLGQAGSAFPRFGPLPPFQDILVDDEQLRGGYLLGRWQWDNEQGTRRILQTYIDRAARHSDLFDWTYTNFDFEFQENRIRSDYGQLTWGLNYRHAISKLDGFTTQIEKPKMAFNRFSAFVQNRLFFWDDQLEATIGTKIEHDDVTGSNFQPTARLLWKPTDRHRLWGAWSRAVATPSRALNEGVTPLAALAPNEQSPLPVVILLGRGDNTLENTELESFELGYRYHPSDQIFLDASIFYNRYKHFYETMPKPPELQTEPVPFLTQLMALQDTAKGKSKGLELALDWVINPNWSIQASYGYFDLDIEADSPFTVDSSVAIQGPQQQFAVRSAWNLSNTTQFDIGLRFVDSIEELAINDYTVLDFRLAWQPTQQLEFSIVGQNLLDDGHEEFTREALAADTYKIPSTVYGKLEWRF